MQFCRGSIRQGGAPMTPANAQGDDASGRCRPQNIGHSLARGARITRKREELKVEWSM